MAQNTEQYFDEIASDISNRNQGRSVAGKNNAYYEYKRRRLQRAFDSLPLKGKSVVEVGCGPGSWVIRCHSLGAARVAGCDISGKMLEMAAAHVRAAGIPDVALKKGEGGTVPFGDREFDVVYTITVLQHNTDEARLRELMHNICRVARHEVWLMEDTARIKKGKPSYMRRPVSFYAQIMGEHRWALKDTLPINTFWSELICNGFLFLLGQKSSSMGSTAGQWANRLMILALPVTALLDRLPPSINPLTIMRFTPQSAAQ